jgi:hypothetical protein
MQDILFKIELIEWMCLYGQQERRIERWFNGKIFAELLCLFGICLIHHVALEHKSRVAGRVDR